MDASKTPIELAIECWHAQQHLPSKERKSMRQIARDFDVNVSTLSNKVSLGISSHKDAAAMYQSITPEEEQSLFDYIQRMDTLGHSITPGLAVELAVELRRKRIKMVRGEDCYIPPLGRNWMSKFRSRYPEVKNLWSKSIDRNRLDGTTLERLIPWFTELKTMMDKHQYPPEHIFNMDESGYGIGTTQSTMVLVVRDKTDPMRKQKERPNKAQPGRQEWVSTVECISADGIALPPLVIFKNDGPFNDRWLPRHADNLFEDWHWSTSQKGWTSNAIALEWLTKLFIPLTKPPEPDQRRLLILDGHGSHVRADFIARCMENKIDLMVLPSHLSHKTQPLDVGVFAALKGAISREVNRTVAYDRGTVPRSIWVEKLRDARVIGMSKHNIKIGFRKTGIYPLNPLKVVSTMSPPSTPPPSGTPLSRTPLGSLTLDNNDFITQYPGVIDTPVKNKLKEATARSETLHAQNVVLEQENMKLKDAQKAKKSVRKGNTVAHHGTHIFSTQTVLRTNKCLEAEAKDRKKRRYAAKQAQVGRLGSVDHNDSQSE